VEAQAATDGVLAARGWAPHIPLRDNGFRAGTTLLQLADQEVATARLTRTRATRGGIDDVPVVGGGARHFLKPRKLSLAQINVLGHGLCGVDYKDKDYIRAVVRRAAIEHFVLGRKFCHQGTGDVANAVADVERDVPCLAQAKRSWAACALLARAVRNRTAGARRRTKAAEVGAAASGAGGGGGGGGGGKWCPPVCRSRRRCPPPPNRRHHRHSWRRRRGLRRWRGCRCRRRSRLRRGWFFIIRGRHRPRSHWRRLSGGRS